MIEKKDFLGIGWQFPPCFHKNGVLMVENNEDIKQSLEILLSTNKGERIFRSEYGCNIRKWVFTKMNLSERTLMIDTIKQAIENGEPRITIKNIDITIKDELEGVLAINISYFINQTNSPDNIVFPFYLQKNE